MKYILLLSILLTSTITQAGYFDSEGRYVDTSGAIGTVEYGGQYNQGYDEKDSWFEYDTSNAPKAIVVPEYETVEYFETSPSVQYFDYTPTYNSGCTFGCDSYEVNSYNFQPSYGSGTQYQYQDSVYVSCFPNKYKTEKGQNITWKAIVNSSSAVEYEWEGDELDGETSSIVTVNYSSTGEKKAYVNVTAGGESNRYTCGSVFVEEPPLYISCSPDKTFIEEGDSVEWSANISGGDGSYDLEWDGHREIRGKNNDDVTVRYKKSGSYSADLEVRSGSQTRTVYCGNVLVSGEYSSPLRASCNANKSYAHINEVVEWKINATGGKGRYDYEWRGTDPVDGRDDRDIRVKYSTLGRKYAEAEVCSDNDCIDIQCGSVTVSDKQDIGNLTYKPAYSGLDGSCVANKTDVTVGEEVIWQATVNQPVPTSLFVWNGTDNLNELRGDRQIITYSTPGIKEGSFSVRTDSGELFSFICPNTINVRPLEAGTGLLSLGQVPYTGPGDVLKVVGLILLLMIWSGVTVVIIRRRIGKRKVTNIIDRFKHENMNS